MNGASPEDPKLPVEAPDSYVFWGSYDPQAGHSSYECRAEENTLEAGRAAGEDEILRSGRDRDADWGTGRPAPIKEQAATEVGGEWRTPTPTDERYVGWLPTDKAFTGGEVVVAVLVAEALFAVSLVALTMTERWTIHHAPVRGSEILLALSVGLLCGLYVILRLKVQRLAWRRQLGGQGRMRPRRGRGA